MSHHQRCGATRGGVLLEVLISIALFVGASAFALAAMRTTFNNIERSQRDQFAVDLAASKMAELEAGLISIADLRGSSIREVGSRSLVDERSESQRDGNGWTCEVRTRRTQYRDLTLVELTVREDRAGPDEPQVPRFTVRRLIRLRDFDPDDFEEDELLRGLDTGGGE